MENVRLSIHVARYIVNLTSGSQKYHCAIKDIRENHKQVEVSSVFDRRTNTFLDIASLWKARRGRIVNYGKRKH